MFYLLIYLVIGSAFGLWTAMNHVGTSRNDQPTRTAPSAGEIVAAHILVALAWPLSVGAMVHSIFRSLSSGPTTD